ncbi:MAG: alpha/beta hydrolase [Thermoleophilia bacterium]|nr:alpha/beta hydrolase [Thermoleophilia bacterium]
MMPSCFPVAVERWRDRGYIVVSGNAGQKCRAGLGIHGYGGNSEEMLGLAVSLACRLPLKLLLFDLPGHGGAASVRLTLPAATRALTEALGALDDPDFLVGHSLGARLGLNARTLKSAALLSMPGRPVFEGSRSRMLRILRARRVNETSPLSGLREILAGEARPAEKTLLLCARRDLESVTELADAWEKAGVSCFRIEDCGHNDIISAPGTAEAIAGWLKEN